MRKSISIDLNYIKGKINRDHLVKLWLKYSKQIQSKTNERNILIAILTIVKLSFDGIIYELRDFLTKDRIINWHKKRLFLKILFHFVVNLQV